MMRTIGRPVVPLFALALLGAQTPMATAISAPSAVNTHASAVAAAKPCQDLTKAQKQVVNFFWDYVALGALPGVTEGELNAAWLAYGKQASEQYQFLANQCLRRDGGNGTWYPAFNAAVRAAKEAAQAKYSEPPFNVPPAFSLSGMPALGQLVHVTLSESPAPVPSPTATKCQWLRNGAPIPGATGCSYRPNAADQGKSLSVATTSERAGYRAASAVLPAVKVAGKVIKIKVGQRKVVLAPGDRVVIPAFPYVSADQPALSGGAWSTCKVAAVTAKNGGKRAAVKALKPGRCTVTIKAGKAKAKIAVVVKAKANKAKPTKVTAKVGKQGLKPGQVTYASAAWRSMGATRAVASYQSSTPSVASVDKAGRVVAHKPGAANLAAKVRGVKSKVVRIVVR